MISPLEGPNETGDTNLNKKAKLIHMVTSKTNVDQLKLVELESYNWKQYQHIHEQEMEKKKQIDEKYDQENSDYKPGEAYRSRHGLSDAERAGLKFRLDENRMITQDILNKRASKQERVYRIDQIQHLLKLVQMSNPKDIT